MDVRYINRQHQFPHYVFLLSLLFNCLQMPRDCLHKILMLRNKCSYIVGFLLLFYFYSPHKVAFDQKKRFIQWPFFFFFFKHQFVFASLDVVCYIKLFIFTEWKLIIVYEIPNTYGHSVGQICLLLCFRDSNLEVASYFPCQDHLWFSRYKYLKISIFTLSICSSFSIH